MADDLNRQPGVFGQQGGHLAHHGLAVRFQDRLAGVEHDPVEDVHREPALQVGDGHVPGLKVPAHLIFQGLGHLRGRLLRLLQLGHFGLQGRDEVPVCLIRFPGCGETGIGTVEPGLERLQTARPAHGRGPEQQRRQQQRGQNTGDDPPPAGGAGVAAGFRCVFGEWFLVFGHGALADLSKPRQPIQVKNHPPGFASGRGAQKPGHNRRRSKQRNPPTAQGRIRLADEETADGRRRPVKSRHRRLNLIAAAGRFVKLLSVWKIMKRRLFIALLGLLPFLAATAAPVGLVKIDGAIGPATASYIARAIGVAAARGDECLILQLNTPGGLLDSASEIVQTFYAAKLPTVVYVAPAPARAGSAGVFITMAADVAVMAPHTRIGAAHPVELGATGQVQDTGETMKKKIENDTVAFAQSIAEKRNRNAAWAKASVLDSASITAEEALDRNVIDFIAPDLPDLLKQLEGREAGDKTLHTAGATIAEIPMNAWERFSQLFLRPEVMFILMLMVIYGIIGELSSPGAILPGIVGAIALILVLYMSAILPVNVTGLVLIGLAIALFIADVFATTHGVLTAGGVISFFLGALMLFSNAGPGYSLSLAWIIPGTLVTALFFIFVVGKGVGAQFKPVRAGKETMPGQTVNAQSNIDARGGRVFIEGEMWNAVSETPVAAGQPVVVTGIEGLTLKVKPKN
jgi:membrane-bound serine protease (ClpP class)